MEVLADCSHVRLRVLAKRHRGVASLADVLNELLAVLVGLEAEVREVLAEVAILNRLVSEAVVDVLSASCALVLLVVAHAREGLAQSWLDGEVDTHLLRQFRVFLANFFLVKLATDLSQRRLSVHAVCQQVIVAWALVVVADLVDARKTVRTEDAVLDGADFIDELLAILEFEHTKLRELLAVVVVDLCSGEAAIDVVGARVLVLALVRVHLAEVSVDGLAIRADFLGIGLIDTDLVVVPVACAHLAQT